MTVAAGDAHPFPIYAGRMRLVFPILDDTGALVTGAASLDSERSIDMGTFADCTNEATEIATSSGMYYLDLTATETTGKSVTVIVKTTTTDAKTTALHLPIVRMSSVRTGTAQAGAAGTITLDASASANTNAYVGCFVQCTNNTPTNVQGQTRRIISYNGSTKVATVDSNWGTNPSNATTFSILVPQSANVAGWAGQTPANVTTAGVPIVGVGSNGLVATSIATGAITNAKFAAGAIDAAAIASNAIADAKIATGALTAAKFAASAITSTVLADNAITAAKLASDAITAAKIAADAITAAKVADGTIDAATFAAGAINASAIASDAITAAKVADGTIDAATFAAGAINAAAIAADALTAAKIAADVGDEFANALLDLTAGVETGATVRQAMRLILAVAAGDASALDSSPALFKDTSGTKNRISSVQDGSSRTITRDVS